MFSFNIFLQKVKIQEHFVYRQAKYTNYSLNIYTLFILLYTTIFGLPFSWPSLHLAFIKDLDVIASIEFLSFTYVLKEQNKYLCPKFTFKNVFGKQESFQRHIVLMALNVIKIHSQEAKHLFYHFFQIRS